MGRSTGTKSPYGHDIWDENWCTIESDPGKYLICLFGIF
jgi:hypothetical protein